jgi:hypothetical protein
VQFGHAIARLSPFTLVTYAGTVKRAKPLFPDSLCRRRVVAFHRRNIVTSASTATFTTTFLLLLLLLRFITSILSSYSTPGVNGLASWLEGSRMSQYWAKQRIDGLDLTMVRRHSGDLAEVLEEGEERERR